MKAASVNELKEELKQLPANKLVEICIRLVKYKKENKELLNYLLLESIDELGYINAVKNEIRQEFENVNSSNLYFAKKTIRKILRITNKHIRYIGTKQAEAELLIYFCFALKQSGIAFEKSTALYNLYQSQVKKADKAVETMHEDLQYDYKKELNKLK
jgi:copper chaperone CopZ